jgi:hypothetical protein
VKITVGLLFVVCERVAVRPLIAAKCEEICEDSSISTVVEPCPLSPGFCSELMVSAEPWMVFAAVGIFERALLDLKGMSCY